MAILRTRLLLCSASLLVTAAVWAQAIPSRPPDYNYFDARVHDGSPQGSSIELRPVALSSPLGPRSQESASWSASPQSGSPETIARGRLALRDASWAGLAFSAFDLPLEALYESKAAGLTHLVFRPHYAGVPFFGAPVQVHLDQAGRVWRVHQRRLPPPPRQLALAFDARQAVEQAARIILPDTDLALRIEEPQTGAARRVVFSSPALLSPVPVSLVWFPLASATVAGWQLFLDAGPQGSYTVVVDAESGEILFSNNLARETAPQGTVFAAPATAHPAAGSRSSQPFTGWPAAAGACPADVYPSLFASGPQKDRCWAESTNTAGNNASVCLDLSGANACGGHASSPQAHFDFDFTNSYALVGDPAPDRAAALTNAFYWANTAHDWLYRLGFDEAAGNFQADNFGRGGLGGDPVRVDVQDGLVNGASMITPVDGLSPRLQLGLYTSLRRDSSFDGDVILHEYVHGLTTRLIGGPGDVSGLPLWQSGALGEGWSDAYAASFTDDPVVGEYMTGNPTSGLRTVAYDQSPYTFGRFGTLFLKVVPGTGGLNLAMPQVHRDGEIWGSVMWDVRSLLGRQDFEQLITVALKLTPSRPSMLDARDAVLQAALAMNLGGVNTCNLWATFAARGFGSSALLNPIEAGQENDTALSVFEAFESPLICGGVPLVLATVLEEDAEADGAWTATGQWHRTTRRAASGLWSWWFGQEASGDYMTGARAFGSLTSPPINLTGATHATVEWDQFLEGEGFGSSVNLGAGGAGAYLNSDSGRLLVSPDGGASWQTVTALAHNSPAGTFVHYGVDLTRFAGQTIQISFSFDTFDGDFNQHEGWFLDNIRVSAVIPEVPVLAVSPGALLFAGAAGGANPSPQLLAIVNAGLSVLDWTAAVTQGSPWLQLSSASGSGDASLIVSTLASGMSPGVYLGVVEISAPGAVNSPMLRDVTLTVASAASATAHWSFNEATPGSGVVVADSSPNGRHGLTTGFGTVAVPGVAGNARLLNGYSDWIEEPSLPQAMPDSFTLRTWIKLHAYPTSGYGMVAASYGGNYKGWFLAVTAEGKVVFLGTKAPSVALWLVASPVLALERWYSISVTYHRPSGAGVLYLDGVARAQFFLPGMEIETNRPLTFGRSSWHNGYYLNFAIDETRIDPVARSATGVAADFATFTPPAPVPNPALTAEWTFTNQAQDVSGNAHHGSLLGTQEIPGVLGTARRFSGSSTALTAPAAARLTPSRFTMRAWVRLQAYPSNFGIVAANYGGNYQGWFAAVRSDGRVIVSQSRLPGSALWTVSNTSLALNRWYHLTITFDGWLRQLKIYVDGALDKQDALLGLTPQTAGVFTAGKSSWHNGYYLNFDLDELRLTPAALSAAQVQTDFASFPAQ